MSRACLLLAVVAVLVTGCATGTTSPRMTTGDRAGARETAPESGGGGGSM